MGILFKGDPNAFRFRRQRIEPPLPKGEEYNAEVSDVLSCAADGYQTGVSWKQDYRPGGLHVSATDCKSKRDRILANAWFSGFDAGLRDNPNRDKLSTRVHYRGWTPEACITKT